jgi:hypothetical protein
MRNPFSRKLKSEALAPHGHIRLSDAQNLIPSGRKMIGLVVLGLSVFAVLSQAAETYVIAHFPYGGGWSTQIWVSNTGASSATVDIAWFDQTGAPALVPLQGVGPVSTQHLVIGPNNTQVVGGDVTQRNATGPNGLIFTWATATSSSPVNVFSMFDFAGSSVATVVPASQVSSSVGTQSLIPATSFRFPVVLFAPNNQPRFNAGVAVANPNNSQTTLTVKLLSAGGTITGTIQRNLPANGQTTFVLTDSNAFLNVLDPSTPFTGSLVVCVT